MQRTDWYHASLIGLAAILMLGVTACGKGSSVDGAWSVEAPETPGTVEELIGTSWVVQRETGVTFGEDGVLYYGPPGAGPDAGLEGTYELDGDGILSISLVPGKFRKGTWDGENLILSGEACEPYVK